MSKKEYAFCYASGLIKFGRTVPDGALEIARGPRKNLHDFIEVKARHGYRTEDVRGRRTKIRGSDHLLVPGIPEAPDQSAAGDALGVWLDWISDHAPAGVSVRCMTH